MRSLLKYVRAVVRFVLIITNNLYCIPTHVVWLLLLTPVRKYAPEIYYRIEGTLFSWLLAMVSLWSWSAGYQIVEQGDDIGRCLNSRTLVIVNHQSTADVPMLMAAFNSKPGVLNHIMWIMDRMFRYTNFGVVSSYHEDFFIASGKARRDESIMRLKTHLKKAYIPLGRKWMVLFPEGGFLRKRRPISQRFAEKMNLPVMQNVTLPRMGALFVVRDTLMMNQEENNGGDSLSNTNLLLKDSNYGDNNHSSHEINCQNNINNNNNNIKDQQLLPERIAMNGKVAVVRDEQSTVVVEEKEQKKDRPELDFVLDITIGYPDKKPLDLQSIIFGLRRPCETVLYYRLYSTKEIPRDDSSLSTWMYERFIEKDKLLEDFYKHKTFVKRRGAIDETKGGGGCDEEGKLGSNKMGNGKMNGGGDHSINRNLRKEREGDLETSCVLQQDLLRFIILHLFFITSTYFHYQLFTTLVQNCRFLYAFFL